MLKPVKILLLEDVESDAYLIERQFKKGNLEYTFEVVNNKSDFLESLNSRTPHIILSDYYLSDINGLEALSLLRKINKNIPFIIVTGALDEETAVKCIKAGADDYLTKEKLTRLVSAVSIALEKRNAVIEKEKAQIKTEQIAKELQLLIQKVNSPIIIIDNENKIIEWNTAAESLTGRKKTEVLHTDLISLCFKNNKNEIEQIISKTKNGTNVLNAEIRINTKSGDKRILINTNEHKDVDNISSGVVIIGQDITEIAIYRSILEEKVEERTKDLKKALEKEKDLVELKSRFVSMASHEFRTPLAAIGFASGFLKKYYDKIDKKITLGKLDKIDNQIQHMTELLDDVLTMGKTESGITVKKEEIEFNTFIQQLFEEVLAVTKYTHKINVKFSDKQLMVSSDKILLRKIFLNLLVNAVKFSPDKNQIQFEALKKDDTLICNVIDFGIGIPENECEDIFEPFYRAKNTETIQGTGLGLPIVKDSAEALGGSIKVKSTAGKETCFTVQLPVK